jgi:biotin-(acetyl-CoA carboxylase) ligase
MYLSHLWRKDEPAVFFDNSSSSGFTGMIRGLSDVGHLLIETNEGELREFAFKEISYVIAD